MKPRIAPTALAVAIVAVLLLDAASAIAQQGRSTIGFVDIKRLLREAKSAQSIRGQVEKLSQALSDDVGRARAKWRKEEKDIAAKRAILSPERFDQIRREFVARVEVERRALEARRGAIDRGVNESMAKVQDVFGEIAKEIAKERSIAVLFRRASAVLVPDSLDITSEALKRLDQRLPSVAVRLAARDKPNGGRR